MDKSAISRKNIAFFSSGVAVLCGLYLTSRYSYLLFHGLAEVFSIVVACGIFMLFWNARRFLDDGYFLFIGIAHLFIGGLDLLHTLAYKGMGVFPGYDADLPTQLWVTARYVESLSLLAAPLFLRRSLKPGIVFAGYLIVVFLLLGSIFYWNVFPDCFVEGAGLTSFKKSSEYIISLILLASIVLMFRKRREFDSNVFQFLTTSIVVTIGSELTFTLYTSVYGLPNLIGHLLKIVSFYLIYKAFIEVGLTKPYTLLFRNLKQSEEALRESERRYRQLFEGIGDAIMVYGSQGGFLDCNEATLQRLGYSRQEFLRLRAVDIVHPDFHPAMEDNQERIWAGETTVLESAHRCKDGAIIPVEVNARRIEYKGEPATLSVVRDITERLRAEEALRQYATELEASNEELDAFAHTVAHDLKNPLARIIGFAEILEKDYTALPDEELRRYLHMMAQNGRKMNNIIDELLLLATVRKMEEVEMEPLDMEDIVAEAQGRLAYMIEEYQAEVILPERWPVALGYGPWVEEVWVNYLSNALKYGGDPPRVELGFSILDLGLRRERSVERLPILDSSSPQEIQSEIQNQKSKIAYWVRDNGPGLTPEEQERLFTPFTQLDPRTWRVKGYGLGLSIVRRIVEKLGGEVGVESQVGQGSVFWFILPYKALAPSP